MKKQTILKIGLPLMLLALGIAVLSTIDSGQSATDVTATGSGTLNATPSVSSVDFCQDNYALATSVDVWQDYRVNFTISTSAQMGDILNATIYVYDDSDHGANYNTTSATGSTLVTFLWVERT